MHSRTNELTRDDFIVFGNIEDQNDDGKCDKNLIADDEKNDFLLTFSDGDNLMTYRGISINDSIRDVFERYGKEEMLPFDFKNDVIFKTTIKYYVNNNVPKDSIDIMRDFKNFKGNEKWVEYSYKVSETKMIYLIRFYFDTFGKIVLISYFAINCNFKIIDRRMKGKTKKHLNIRNYSNSFSTRNKTFTMDISMNQ